MKPSDLKKLKERTKIKARIRRAIDAEIPYAVLSIDPATMCGWALDFKNYGCWNLAITNRQSIGAKWMKLEMRINELIRDKGVKMISTELPVKMPGQLGATIHHAKLNGILEKICAEKDIEMITITPSELKKFATGNGRASKEDMIEAARKFLGYEGDNDNEADALWLNVMLRDFLISKFEK